MFTLNQIVDNEFVALWRWISDVGMFGSSSHLAVIIYFKGLKLPIYKKVNLGAYILIDNDNIYIDSLNELNNFISPETGNFKENSFYKANERKLMYVRKNDIALLNEKTSRIENISIYPYYTIDKPLLSENRTQYEIKPTPATQTDSPNNELTQCINELEKQNQELSQQIKQLKNTNKN